MNEIITMSPEETFEVGRSIAKDLKKGDVYVLTGELGSGKTKFTEGVLSYFGLEKEISSPTFTIVNEYYSQNLNIYHFDVYRLTDEDEFTAIGGEEYFEKGVCIIEWGEMIEQMLPNEYTQIIFSRDSENDNIRKLVFKKIKK